MFFNFDNFAKFKNFIKSIKLKFASKIKDSTVAKGIVAKAQNGDNYYGDVHLNTIINHAKEDFETLGGGIIPPQGIQKDRYSKLKFDFATKSIDMEENIKNIFKHCNKLCLEQLSDDKKYRILHNLNDIISKLSYADILKYKELYNLLQPGYYQIDMNYLRIGIFGQQDESVTMFKNFGLIDIITDIYSTNSAIKQTMQQMDKKISNHGSARPFSISPTMLNNEFLKASLVFTREGKILIHILKSIDIKTSELSQADLEEIFQILNS